MKDNLMAEKYNLKEMLSYMRPEGSSAQTRFCNRYLLPTFGTPDIFGNYVKIIGDKPPVAFMAHHDTVHKFSGKQIVTDAGGFFSVQGAISNCLGADCTTGVYIILKMIEAKVPGVYVVHAAEEVGCIGSAGMVAGNPDWIKHVRYAISFDRMGYSSVITHQMGRRTCSDAFADSLCDILGMSYEKDAGGVYTDSNEYRSVIPECTNISVGYFSQHTKVERQDKVFLKKLVNTLIKADWDNLVESRDPSVEEYDDSTWTNYRYSGYWSGYDMEERYDSKPVDMGPIKKRDNFTQFQDTRDMMDIIKESPLEIALLLRDIGYDAYDLVDEVVKYNSAIENNDDPIAF